MKVRLNSHHMTASIFNVVKYRRLEFMNTRLRVQSINEIRIYC